MYKPFHPYHVYILTNKGKTTLYVGVTNNLHARLIEHWKNRGIYKTFAGRYSCFNLIYFEAFEYIQDAIEKEKKIKNWNRKKKEALILTKNPEWRFLNKEVLGQWPPEYADSSLRSE